MGWSPSSCEVFLKSLYKCVCVCVPANDCTTGTISVEFSRPPGYQNPALLGFLFKVMFFSTMVNQHQTKMWENAFGTISKNLMQIHVCLQNNSNCKSQKDLLAKVNPFFCFEAFEVLAGIFSKVTFPVSNWKGSFGQNHRRIRNFVGNETWNSEKPRGLSPVPGMPVTRIMIFRSDPEPNLHSPNSVVTLGVLTVVVKSRGS